MNSDNRRSHIILLAALLILTLGILRVSEAGTIPARYESNVNPNPLTGVGIFGTDYQDSPVEQTKVVRDWDAFYNHLAWDGSALVVIPRFESQKAHQDEYDMIWLDIASTSQVVGYQTFSCFYLYTDAPGMAPFFECGPLQTEDNLDGSAVFYIDAEILQLAFESPGSYAVVVADIPEN